jgi:hypothetical protein
MKNLNFFLKALHASLEGSNVYIISGIDNACTVNIDGVLMDNV